MKYNDVLVLNKSWVPVHIVDYKRCMILLCTEAAHALDHDAIAYTFDDWINFSLTKHPFKELHTSTRAIALPEIITLTRYNRLPRGDVKFSRESVFTRDKYRCGYCGHKFARNELTLDHILPRSKGGLTVWDNVISCCRACNAFKADKSLKECGLKLKIKPHAPKWMDPIMHLYKKGKACSSWGHFLHRIDIYESTD